MTIGASRTIRAALAATVREQRIAKGERKDGLRLRDAPKV